MLHLGRIDLRPKAAKEGSVSRPLRASSVGFTYFLQHRGRGVLAGYSTPLHNTPSRSDSLTSYSSEGEQY